MGKRVVWPTVGAESANLDAYAAQINEDIKSIIALLKPEHDKTTVGTQVPFNTINALFTSVKRQS